MTTALVQTHDGLPSIADASRKLAELVGRGDTETLNEVRAQAAAHQEYEIRREAQAHADHYGQIKVLAEAAIGAIDLLREPRGYDRRNGKTELKLGDMVVPRDLRKGWRLLAVGQRQGLLEAVLEELNADPLRSVTTSAVYNELKLRGAGWVATKPLRDRFKELERTEELTLPELAREVGRDPGTVGQALGVFRNHGEHQFRVRYDTGAALADKLGLDSTEPVPHKRQSPKRKRKPPPPRKLTGGRWDETYSRLRRCLDEFASVAGEDTKWDDAYAHFYALEAIIGKAMKAA